MTAVRIDLPKLARLKAEARAAMATASGLSDQQRALADHIRGYGGEAPQALADDLAVLQSQVAQAQAAAAPFAQLVACLERYAASNGAAA